MDLRARGISALPFVPAALQKARAMKIAIIDESAARAAGVAIRICPGGE